MRIFVLLLCLPALLPADAVDDYLRGFIQRHDIPGLSVAVSRNGKLVKAAGYGTANLELNVPASKETIYEIGSISKHFTAEAILMLADEGKLSIEDNLNEYVPGTPDSWKDITLRHILAHRSGLPDWDGKGTLSYRRDYTQAEYIAIAGGPPLEFQPGSKFAYTSAGYPLLGFVIQAVTGKPFEDFAVDRIFRPAGMKTARYKHNEDVVPNRSGAYVGKRGSYQHGEVLRPRIIAPSGGVMASVLDFAAWESALSEGKLLKPATLDMMQSNGIGFFANQFHGHRMVLHNGSTLTGFSSVVYRYLDDHLMVVILCNVDRWNAVNVAAEHVAGIFVPGVSVSSLQPQPDPDSRRTEQILTFFKDLAAGKDPAMLDESLLGKIPQDRRSAIAEHLSAMRQFLFLEDDKGTIRYRMDSRNPVYYTVVFNDRGKVTRFLYEED